MSSTTARRFATVAVCILLIGCGKAKQPETKAASSASARPVSSAGPGLTEELDQLVRLTKTELSPEEKRARLKTVLEKFPREHSKEREALIVQAVARGAYDPPKWTTITSNFKGRRARIQVSSDALTILGVRVDVTAEGAQRIADELHTILPTPRILQLIWEQAEVRIEPCNSTPDAQMASTLRMLEHSACVDQRIAGRKGMVANEGKHWVLSNRIAGKDNLAANYGWFIKGRRPVQTVGTRHDTAHTDYSQIVRLVKPIISVDGRDIDIRKVGRSTELWGLVSDEGPLLVWRATKDEATPTPGDKPVVAAAKAPKPGDPATVRVSLKSDGMPLRPEALPRTTTALRRTTLSRRLLTSLRMRLEDVPDEAFWSAGAAACGGRDVFFELMNEVPVDLAELEGSKDALASALACGKLLTPLMRAGASLYDIEYDVESMPSGFALLALSDDSFRDKLSYPPLSPTPTGVHRAYCSDDTGGARAACQDGARSRLLLAVNHGYIAAYAGDVPTLLDRLSRSEPPPADVAELAAFFLEPAQAEEVAVAKAGGTCGFAMDFAFVDLSPDETNRQRVLDAINDNAVLCGMQASGSVLNPTRRMLFLTKDGAAAETIRSALKRRALEVRLESGLKMPTHQEEFTKALRSAVARAGAAAKFELEGRRLAVTLSVKPNAAELQGMGKLLDARAALAKQAADVVRGLAEGKLPSASALESFRVPPSGAN